MRRCFTIRIAVIVSLCCISCERSAVKHILDGCYNDGVMWRASVDQSAITGGLLEFLIPFDAQDYEEGDLIPDHYKETYDLYVEKESRLKPVVAELLCRWSESHGHPAGPLSPDDTDEVLAKFDFFHVAIPENLPTDARVVALFFFMDGVEDDVPGIVADLKSGDVRFAD